MNLLHYPGKVGKDDMPGMSCDICCPVCIALAMFDGESAGIGMMNTENPPIIAVGVFVPEELGMRLEICESPGMAGSTLWLIL